MKTAALFLEQMRLSDEARSEVEEFFRGHFGDPTFSLPEIEVHAGAFSKLLMHAVGMGAITFGRHVFVNPRLTRRGPGGRVCVPGWLVVHEAAHVLQYEERGSLRFLRDYLRNYWRALRAGGSWNGAARTAAYMGIAEERAAQEAERSYRGRGGR